MRALPREGSRNTAVTEKSGHSRSQGSARDDGLEGLGRLRKHFGRYAQDTAGILLIALAILALLATWGLTAGGLVTPFTQFLAIWLGCGLSFAIDSLRRWLVGMGIAWKRVAYLLWAIPLLRPA